VRIEHTLAGDHPKEQLGIELGVNNQADYRELFKELLNGVAVPLNELK
jgi:hypothetical protein